VPYMKTKMVESHRERMRSIESGELKVVGQNIYTEAEPSPLQEGEDGGIMRVDETVERSAIEAVERWRSARDAAAVERALAELERAAADPEANLMPPTLAAARAGATTGEWAAALRSVFGDYRGPTGVGDATTAPSDDALSALRDRVERVSESLGRRVKILVGKPGLDGHSNGAEQIAVRARDAGMDVVYEGIRLTPARIARTAIDEGVHVVGLSILSGSHAELIPTVLNELEEAGVDVPVVVGGIIPPADEAALLEAGVARVYTPKDFEVSRIMGDIVDLVAEHHGVTAASA
jgi:ethylmalonyl-CoA mutase